MTPSPEPTAANVTIVDFAFTPAVVTIRPGDQVTWTNQDSAAHTSTSASDLWDSSALDTAESFTQTFPSVGEFPYFCAIHPGMTGTVRVEAVPALEPSIYLPLLRN
ncbi:amicyanin [Candidatus Gracilibacteria bacterium]|nr:amicyanin [Candidatus Gracilibacteria bacterium]